jgi:hypothetical protein
VVYPFKYIAETWTSESDRFIANAMYQMLGIDTWTGTGGLMIGKPCIAMVMLAASSTGSALEAGVMPVPTSVNALGGCWEGQGTVMGKAVAIAVNAYPIVQDAMLAVEAASSALADPQDQYAAHLVFGGTGRPSKTGAGPIVGYWADSFVRGSGARRKQGRRVRYYLPISGQGLREPLAHIRRPPHLADCHAGPQIC